MTVEKLINQLKKYNPKAEVRLNDHQGTTALFAVAETIYMNGYEFKREIERIFKVARSMYPNVTDDMLDTNGTIYYMNGNDSTPFDWNCNNRLCEFSIFHKNEFGFVTAYVNSDNTIDICIYETYDAMEPSYTFTEEMENLKARDFAKIMNYIADDNQLWNKPIDELDWDVDVMECDEID